MPPRKVGFEATTLQEGIVKVLREAGKAMHADEIVEAIFTVRTAEERRAAKQTIVSESLRAAEHSLVAKLGKNRYEVN